MSAQVASGALGKLWTGLERLGRLARAGQWWDYKLAPIFAVFYATALTLQVPVPLLWSGLAQLLFAIVPGAAYVSLVNDLTDQADDLAAGKPNRMTGRSGLQKALLIGLPVTVGVGFAWLWRGDPLLLWSYLGAWAAFSLYSLPPVRLKVRGGFGVLADAAGAHMFPSLVAAALAAHLVGQSLNVVWLAAVAAWALAYGARGILWHQIGDAEFDERSKTGTFVQRRSSRFAARLGAFVAFPVEIAAFGLLLWQVDESLVFAGLALYIAFCWLRIGLLDVRAAVVQPGGAYFLIGHLYYDLLLPLSLLAAYAVRSPAALWVLGLHLIFFAGRSVAAFDELWGLRRKAREAMRDGELASALTLRRNRRL